MAIKAGVVVVFFLTLLITINMASAAPPLTTVFTGDVGLQIETHIFDTYKLGEPRYNVIHIFNTTNGYQITPTTNPNILCKLYLRDSQGFLIGMVNSTEIDDHWDLNGSGGANNPIGSYAWTLYCLDSDAEWGGYTSGYFIITPTGQILESVNAIIVYALMSLAFIFLALSYFFKDDYWILKSFFQFMSVLAGLIAVNSARIIASESDTLGTMGTAGLLLLIVSVGLFFLWIFVRAFKEIIKIFKEKGDLRWSYD